MILAAAFACLAPFLHSDPAIASDVQSTFETARAEVSKGEQDRAIQTFNCILMPDRITIGLGGRDSLEPVVRDAINSWNERLGGVPFDYTSAAQPAIRIQLVQEISGGGDVQGQIHYHRDVFWGKNGNHYKVTGEILIRDNVRGRSMSHREMTSVLEHELGHLLGLDDDPDPSRLMGPFRVGWPVDGPTMEEVQKLQQFRGSIRDELKAVAAKKHKPTRWKIRL